MSLEQLAQFVIDGNAEETQKVVKKLLDEGISATTILNDGLLKGMEEVGKLFKAMEIYVPEVLVAARAMQLGVNELKPFLAGSGSVSEGTVVIGTVKGDIHDIGKNLVVMMLEGAGFKVIDLGINVPEGKFIEAVKEHKPIVLGLSALLTTTMKEMKVVIDALKEAGLRDAVKVMVGGAPVTQAYADSIGADGYAENASEAVEKIKAICNS
ncbi:MAG: corrinoid protein [Syntrophothermus sp.]|uniref:corrinoid protein n=1 Tax=Syntrophothermus sp. TaxID=2736299 RepID=UPI00257C9E2B|nr:corrinoid protein [Syntrophothermus sp.]NSW84140.1 corrinoid protein [Syntrophothermus sp.]